MYDAEWGPSNQLTRFPTCMPGRRALVSTSALETGSASRIGQLPRMSVIESEINNHRDYECGDRVSSDYGNANETSLHD
jgi:hypothetical protein